LAEMHLTAGPEILPDWNPRLNVHADGQGYDLLLEDLTDKTCGYTRSPTRSESSATAKPSTANCSLVPASGAASSVVKGAGV
jgi:hypothetical protein